MIRGGQGRSLESISDDAVTLIWWVVAAVLLVVAVWRWCR